MIFKGKNERYNIYVAKNTMNIMNTNAIAIQFIILKLKTQEISTKFNFISLCEKKYGEIYLDCFTSMLNYEIISGNIIYSLCLKLPVNNVLTENKSCKSFGLLIILLVTKTPHICMYNSSIELRISTQLSELIQEKMEQ